VDNEQPLASFWMPGAVFPTYHTILHWSVKTGEFAEVGKFCSPFNLFSELTYIYVSVRQRMDRLLRWLDTVLERREKENRRKKKPPEVLRRGGKQ
jgi:hypothetical protein